MATSPPDPNARVAALEAQVRELRTRLAIIEKLLQVREEHPGDQTVVRGKVTYDWQS